MDPETFCLLIGFASFFAGCLIGAVAICPFASRSSMRAYRHGCKATEDRLVGPNPTRGPEHDTTTARIPR